MRRDSGFPATRPAPVAGASRRARLRARCLAWVRRGACTRSRRLGSNECAPAGCMRIASIARRSHSQQRRWILFDPRVDRTAVGRASRRPPRAACRSRNRIAHRAEPMADHRRHRGIGSSVLDHSENERAAARRRHHARVKKGTGAPPSLGFHTSLAGASIAIFARSQSTRLVSRRGPSASVT